jgi:photosystem II stability/assembly factor-like uncharacterized protein
MKKIYSILFFLACFPIYCQWVSQISGVTQNLNDVYCINENFVVTVGDNGTILKTTNGGLNWIQKTSGTIQKLMKVQFANQNTGYAVGESGILLKTSDGGENWLPIPTGVTTNFFGLSVLNENTFFVSGDIGLVLKSNDGGNSFSILSAPENQAISDIQFFNDQVGYAKAGIIDYYMQNNHLYKTVDGGTTWSLVINEFIDSFFFLTENIGFINKTNNGFYKTTDGGLNLTILGNSKSKELDIHTKNENVVWDLGNNYTLCNCDNYCVSKREINQQIDDCHDTYTFQFLFNAIYLANETIGYIVGLNGTILKNGTGINNHLELDKFDKRKIQIYPNPTTGIINFSENITIDSVEIFDNLGRNVKQFSNVENNILDLQNLSNGVYFCIVHSNGEKFTEKIIVDK